ncbi:prepilin peptidase [Candidatus Microgenomates bacterium]|nr:prepilin peptidase [Candidatus Microgenomates bacterium]
MELVMLGILGLIFGSFLTSLTHQTIKPDFSWIKLWRVSKCPKCGHKIKPSDNIPLISYFILGGKCRSCRKRISARYPIIEIVTAVVFVGIFLWGDTGIWTLPYFLFLVTGILALAIVDLEHQILPDKILIPLITIHLSLITIFSPSPILFANLLWAAGASVFFLALVLVTRGRGMGLGDVKLAFLVGLILGQTAWIAIFLAFIIGAVVGLMMITAGRARFGKPIPFGPFLVLGTFIVMVAGEKIETILLGGVI